MRALILTLAAVLFSACGFKQPFDPAATCHFEGFGTFYMQKDRGCDAYKAEAEAARDRLLALGWVRPEEADAVFKATDVWVHDDTPTFDCQGRAFPAGCYVWGTAEIETDTTGSSLLHEYLHRLDDVRGGDGAADDRHEGWDARGWMAEGKHFQGVWYGNMAWALHLFGYGCESDPSAPGCATARSAPDGGDVL